MCRAKVCLLSLGFSGWAWAVASLLWFLLCGIQSSPRQTRHRSQSFYTNSLRWLSRDDLQFSECSTAAGKSSATALCENRLKCWKGWVLCLPQSAWRINGPAASKSVGPVHILCKIIGIQNGHRELSKITPRGSSNKKQANEQNWDFFFFFWYIRISAFKIYLKTLKACHFSPCCDYGFSHRDLSLLGFLTTKLLTSEKVWSAARDVYFFWAGSLWHVVPRWLSYHSANSCFWTHPFSECTGFIFFFTGKVTLPNSWRHRN